MTVQDQGSMIDCIELDVAPRQEEFGIIKYDGASAPGAVCAAVTSPDALARLVEHLPHHDGVPGRIHGHVGILLVGRAQRLVLHHDMLGGHLLRTGRSPHCAIAVLMPA
jgi:hypothetical protein